MIKNSVCLLGMFLICIQALVSQNSPILDFKSYMEMVKSDHPVSFQAGLLDGVADNTRRMARGGFDPKVEADWDHKSFDDKNYFSQVSSALKIPTWYGIDLKAGYDRNNGEFLNNSDFLPRRGLWNAGISVPLGKGLVLDERRAALQKADLFTSMTEQEQVILINELLYEAAQTYLNWQIARSLYDIAVEGQNLAQIRLDGTRQSFINGDKPAIDTLETFIALQNRNLDFQKAEQDLNNARLALNNFLWIKGEVPLELEENTQPEVVNTGLLELSVDSMSLIQNIWLARHPELLLFDFKIADLNVDQRLAREDLKPNIRIEYNPLLAVADDALFDEFQSDEYKLGARFSYPLFLRKERSKLQLNKLKIQDTEFKRSLKTQELNVKLDTYIENIRQSKVQFLQMNDIVANYRRMLEAENRKFSFGESSVFLVNSREVKYLESRVKQVETLRKLIWNRFTYLVYLMALDDVV